MKKIKKFGLFLVLATILALFGAAWAVGNIVVTEDGRIDSESTSDNLIASGYHVTLGDAVYVSKDVVGGFWDAPENERPHNDTSLTIEGGQYNTSETSHIFGGDFIHSVADNITIPGNTNLTISGGTMDQVYGGSGISVAKTHTTEGSVNLTITGGNIGQAYAASGVWNKEGTAQINRGVNVNVSGGDFVSWLTGGSWLNSGSSIGNDRLTGTSKISGDIVINVTGGKINTQKRPLVGIAGRGIHWTSGTSELTGDVKITISGGSVPGLTCGGAYIGGSTNPSLQASIAKHTGNVEILILGDAGINAISGDVCSGDRTTVIGKSGLFAGSLYRGTMNCIDMDQSKTSGTGKIILKNISDLSPLEGILSGQGYLMQNAYGPVADGSTQKSVLGTTTLVFDNVQGVFNGSVVSFDVIEATPGTKVTGIDPAKFDAGTIKLTGNWTNFGTPAVLAFKSAVNVPVDFSEATGITSAAFNEAKTELIVSCKNTPIAVTPATLKLEPGKSDTVKAATYAAGESVSWKSSDTAVATVDSAGKVTAVKAGIAVISATGSASKTAAGCTVTVEDPAAPDPVPAPAPVTPTVVTKEDNPVTKDKDVPETVKPATPVITQATAENTTALAKSADVKEEFFAATADGSITVDPVIAKNAVKYVISDDATVTPKMIVILPVITATVESSRVAALAVKATGA